MYTTFEEADEAKLVKGRSLPILEYDKIIDLLSAHTRTIYGREACYELLPTSDFETVNEWLYETTDALTFITKEGTLPLGGVNDIRDAVSYSDAGGTLSMKNLMQIAQFMRSIQRLHDVSPKEVGKNGEENRLLTLLTMLVVHAPLEKEISFCILTEEEMNDRASETLYMIRKQIRDAQGSIREILERVIHNKAASLQEQLVTMRDGRYCIPVKAERKGDIPGIVHDTSASGQTLFIEPVAVVELNNKIREWTATEKEEMNRILQMLSEKVAQKKQELLTNIHLLKHIDFVVAKANFAIHISATRPLMNNEGKIHLRRARHPLIPKDRVVPIDFSVGDDYKTLVITGPNTGGKTVSLKTCGLLTLMAMSGLYIPCLDHSEVSVFSRVLADIGDEQSIEQSLSTFSSHMTNIVAILKKTGPSTLVLVDELGSGTDPSEGAALAIAILDECRRKGAITVATTHYKELKGYAVETEDVENACCEFDTDTLSPTYRLLIGLPGVSNAFIISKKLGLPQTVIDEAQAVLTQESLQFEELLSSVETNHRESEKLKKEIREMRDFVKKQSDELEKERSAIEAERKKILAKAREEKQELLEEALDEANQMLDEMRKKQNARDKKAAEEELRKIRNNLRAGLSKLDDETDEEKATFAPGEIPDKIREGGLYYAPSLDITGIVIKGPDNKNNCIISSGALRLTVAADTLRYPEKEETTKTATASKTRKGRSSSSVKAPSAASQMKLAKSSQILPEIKLIGMKVDEATSVLDRYLDDCVLTNIGSIRIVHGKGTGALRSAVDQFLRHDSRVKSFRLGTYGEGEDGVTIAELV